MKGFNTIFKEQCVLWVKYYPILMQVIIILNLLEFYIQEYFIPGFNITNWVYPILGHSVAYDLLLLIFSRLFGFCNWHRLLIYNMLFNIVIEWITVNFEVPVDINYRMGVVAVISAITILTAIILRFKIGWKKNE